MNSNAKLIRVLASRIALVILIGSCFSFVPPSELKFSQFVINGLDSREAARVIDRTMRQYDGIVMSRTDFNTLRYLVFHQSNKELGINEFSAWMQEFGCTITCYQEGVRGEEPIPPLSFSTCTENSLPQNITK